jgi:hypothetical protein
MFHLAKKLGIAVAAFFAGRKKGRRRLKANSDPFQYLDELKTRGMAFKTFSITCDGERVEWKVVAREEKKAKG